jgi:crotonobetainyl-CoA:carnitine CoA-transferase CaiB-like acyl-CoA transferase
VSGPLGHLGVVELGDGLPAAWCGRQFAAWGADVAVVEPPDGSPLRRAVPNVADGEGRPVSLLWEYVAANKRSVRCDLDDEQSRRRLRSMIERADVFVTDWRPERLVAAGLDYASLSATTPDLVMLSITPFGNSGPYADFAASDLVIQALSGILSLSGRPGCMPLKLPANILPYGCGVSAFVAAMAALHERRSSGAGQLVEVACVEAVASLVLTLRAQYLGEPFPRRAGVATVFLPCSDGHILSSPAVEAVWNALLSVLAIEPDSVPEPLRTMLGRYADLPAVTAFLRPHTRRCRAQELFERLGTLHVVCGLYREPAQLPADEQLADRGFFQPPVHPRLGRLPFPGPPAHMSETPMLPPSPAPVLGPAPAGPPMPRAATAVREASHQLRQKPPLAGLRVLDLTGAWIGPYAAMLLADLGADVIKIESPRRPDVWRIFRPTSAGRPELPPGTNPRAHPWNTSFYYNSVNRNKRGLTLDLAQSRGKELFRQLVASADVVMENFTPRVMENFGLGYDALRELRPDLVMASFSGYGASGPYRDFKANGGTIETIAGWTALFGYPDEPPMSMGEMEADPLCGLQMAAHVLVALEYRARTGRGQRIDGSMLEAAAGYVGEEVLNAALAGTPAPKGNRDRSMAPHGIFACFGDDEWLALSVRDDADWQALLAVATDAPELRDGRFETDHGRLAAVDELEAAVARWTRKRPAGQLMAALQAAGVPAGVVLKTDALPQDPHFVARGWFRSLVHPDMGTHLYNGYPWRFRQSDLVWRLPSPRVGEHSAAVLSEVLGLDEDEYHELERDGVTGRVLEWPDAGEAGAS